MNKIEQPEPRDQMREHFDDEIQLIDYLRVIWKWKWLIILGTFVCMVVAGVVSFNMSKIYEVSMTIEPGIIGVNSTGKFIYLDSRDNIEGKIKGGLYNRRIEKALNINPLETDITFKVRPQKETNFIQVTSEWKDPEVELGKKTLANLLAVISKEYENVSFFINKIDNFIVHGYYKFLHKNFEEAIKFYSYVIDAKRNKDKDIETSAYLTKWGFSFDKLLIENATFYAVQGKEEEALNMIKEAINNGYKDIESFDSEEYLTILHSRAEWRDLRAAILKNKGEKNDDRT